MPLIVSSMLQYWDDAADAMRPGEGTLLPLWKFTHRRAKRKQVWPLGFVHSCPACRAACMARADGGATMIETPPLGTALYLMGIESFCTAAPPQLVTCTCHDHSAHRLLRRSFAAGR